MSPNTSNQGVDPERDRALDLGYDRDRARPTDAITCHECGGVGKIHSHNDFCRTCRGAGWVMVGSYTNLRRVVAAARSAPGPGVSLIATIVDVDKILDQVDDLRRAKLTLEKAGYTDQGGALWTPPLGPVPPKEDLLVAIMVQADDGQTGFERCRYMLRAVMTKLGLVTL